MGKDCSTEQTQSISGVRERDSSNLVLQTFLYYFNFCGDGTDASIMGRILILVNVKHIHTHLETESSQKSNNYWGIPLILNLFSLPLKISNLISTWICSGFSNISEASCHHLLFQRKRNKLGYRLAC